MSLTYIYPSDAGTLRRLLEWAAARMRETGSPSFTGYRQDATAIGIATDGAVAAVSVYDTFSGIDCLYHVASDNKRRWMTREFIVRSMAYPFLQLGLPRMTATVSEKNEPSLRLTRGFGWTEEGRMRRAGCDGEDVILFGMLREECRWLPENGFRVPARKDCCACTILRPQSPPS